MKENVTKFDLEAAFKALDEIDIPKVGKVRANRPNTFEDVKRVDRLSMLVEDYYNISTQEGAKEAQDELNNDIAKAKLDRIEKIVDLDAKSAEELQPSYVGKVVTQCPNCLNMFYKNPDDIEYSEDNNDLVNIGEICQHCGNDSGYTLVGKIADVTPEAAEPVEETEEAEEVAKETPEGNETEETTEETTEEEPTFDLNDLEAAEETEPNAEKEEKKEESFNFHNGQSLVEDMDEDEIVDEGAMSALSRFRKNLTPAVTEDLATERKLDNYLDNLPELLEDEDIDELEENCNINEKTNKSRTVSDKEFNKLLDFLYKTPVSEDLDEIEEIDETVLDENITNFLTEVYSNVNAFKTTKCEINNNKLIVEGTIKFNSGKNKNTLFEFCGDKRKLIGINESLAKNAKFTLKYNIKNKKLITENLRYKLTIDNTLVEGLTK